MAASDQLGQARADWDQRVGRRRGPGLDAVAAGRLPAPSGLRAVPGRGLVMLDWEPVPGAAGYLVYRAASAGGPFEPLDHGGGDVLAVPAGPYADTTGQAGQVRYYAVAAVADGESAGPRSGAVAAAPESGGPAAVGSRSPMRSPASWPGRGSR
jgi:xylan 1,4-beta-xylosidase